MKIGINARFLTKPHTGIGQYTKNLLQALAEIDRQNQYFLAVPLKVDFVLPKNFHIQVIKEKNTKYAGVKKTLWEQIQVPRFFKQKKVDLIHYLYPCNPRIKTKIPEIVTIHDAIPWTMPEYRKEILTKTYQWNAKKSAKKADLIITVSEEMRKELKKLLKIPQEKIAVSCNAAPKTYFKKVSEAEKIKIRQKYNIKNRFLLYVGGYDYRKNVKRLLESYTKYIAPFFQIDLVLVGGKSIDQALYKSFNHLPKQKNNARIKYTTKIIKTGFIPEKELRTLYQDCLAFVNLSIAEGFNIPLLEAAASKAPIVASDIPVHREILKNSAIFCDSKETSEIGQALIKVIQNTEIRKKLKDKAYKIAKKYSWEITAKNVLNLYKKIILCQYSG